MVPPARLAVWIGLAVVVASVTFPLWSLASYSVTATPVEHPDDEATVVAYEDLSPRERTLVDRTLDGEAVVVYGPWHTHQEADGDLPGIVEDTWLDSHTLGAVVVREGEYYRVSAPAHGEPIFFPILIGIGVLAGVAVAGAGALARRRDWHDAAGYAVAVVGVALLGLLALTGNVDGYLWPMQ